MRLINLVRVSAAILAFLPTIAVIYAAGMIAREEMRWKRVDSDEWRKRNASHLTRSGAWLRHVARRFAGIHVNVTIPNDNRDVLREKSFVYVSNHRSSLDAVTLPAALVATGDTSIRWVVKRGVLRIPLIGALMQGNGYAIVTRHRDAPGMSDAIRQRMNQIVMDNFVRLVRADRVCVGIFPEGERFVGATDGATRRHVGDPSPGKKSFRRMCELFPDHGVANVTVIWPVPPGGKTALDAADLCDTEIEVTVEFFPHVEPDDADQFLEDAWNEKERVIALRQSRSSDNG